MLLALKSLLHSVKVRHDRHLAIRALSAMNDHQLADIGVARGSVVDAVNGNLPLGTVWASR